MRIQHNIMAMNAYRNLGMNNSQLSKNLEKLSSGYRINRAGDDAAGLAISEKMRAQIAGLDQAQKNAQSGINMVQTAEGALTEVHDMLNRMVTLATQAANGTYGESERAKIQAEIDALTEEIDRIADNSNFNGTKLLDGSLASEGTTDVSTAFDAITGALSAGIVDVDSINAKSTVKNVALDSNATTEWESGSTIKMTFGMSDGTTHEIELTAQIDKDENTELVDKDGNVVHTIANNGGAIAAATASDISTALVNALNSSELGKTYEAATGTVNFTLTHLAGGSEGANITSVDITVTDAAGDTMLDATNATAGALVADTTTPPTNQIVGKDATQAIDLSSATIYTAGDEDSNLEDCIFEIGGEKFVFYDDQVANTTNADKAAALEEMAKAGVNFVKVGTSAMVGNADVAKMAALITKETGLEAAAGQTATTNNVTTFTEGTTGTELQISASTTTKATGGMNLQIGASSVETINVAVDSMKADALGIAKLSVGSEKLANAAIDTVNAAIEKVSVQRGNLGAIQNRLEHTINNLGVMEENIQDAEANIRDTDIADQMMAYTKNNILIQSAQAMLAQANQVPQGVLQLMQ